MWSDAGVTVTVAADVVALLLNVKGIMKATTVVAKWFSRVETAVTVLDLAFQNQDVQNALSSALGDTTAANFMYYWKFASIGVNASVLTKSVLDFKGTAQFFKSFLSKNRSKFHGFLSTDAEKALDDFIEETGKVVDDVGEVVGDYSTIIDNSVSEILHDFLPPQVSSTFKNDFYKTVKTQREITLYRQFGEPNAFLKENYATTIKNATRDELAILDEWQNNMRFEVEIRVPVDIKLNIGKVQMQTSADGTQILNGGADQILMPQEWDFTNWVQKIIDKETGLTYTLDDFKNKFPYLIEKL